MMSQTTSKPSWLKRHWVVLVLGIVILVPTGSGFSVKFYRFFLAMREGEGSAFAILPMINYLLVAAGFVCLSIWAVFRGMFRDIEAPKFTMLEHENEIDQLDRTTRHGATS